MIDQNTTPPGPIIVWFRQDLRTDDNLAFYAAATSGQNVICLYILESEPSPELSLGGAQKWWLHHSLERLANEISTLGGTLILRQGDPLTALQEMIDNTGASSLVWNRRYAPAFIKRDSQIKATLSSRGIDVRSYAGQLMHEPTKVKTKTGGFYRVFTPFWRNFESQSEQLVQTPLDAPQQINPYFGNIASEKLADWHLLPSKPDWSTTISASWTPGTKGALENLNTFLDGPVGKYDDGRDLPAVAGTSRLSPHLAFGEISPARIWHQTLAKAPHTPSRTTFLKELVWREFSYHLLVNVDDLATKNYNDTFDHFEWRDAPEHLSAWQRGQTGYPIVDAGMRQLWHTGWMHNRVRMIVGSFLIKHLLIDWRHGERWFWDTLVDADAASNAASWQWVAGSGADASPYFRIFNPITQGEKFDPDGTYVKLFVPELRKLDKKFIHKPWEAPKDLLARASVELGKSYPKPIVDHAAARERALATYKNMKEKSG